LRAETPPVAGAASRYWEPHRHGRIHRHQIGDRGAQRVVALSPLKVRLRVGRLPEQAIDLGALLRGFGAVLLRRALADGRDLRLRASDRRVGFTLEDCY
jgi:hypothetical protein